MSSPIGEPPVRRHLTAEAAALVAQAARGARERELRRLALLGAGAADVEALGAGLGLPSRAGATVPWNSPEAAAMGQAHPAHPAHPVATVPRNRAEAPVRVSPTPGEAATVPGNRAEAPGEAWIPPTPGAAATVPGNRADAPAEAWIPPATGAAATVPWNSADAPARVSPATGVAATVPWNSADAPAAEPLTQLLAAAAHRSAKAGALQREWLALSPPHSEVTPATEPVLTHAPATAPFPSQPSAPFGPAPAASGRHPAPSEPHPVPIRTVPPPAFPESALLAEERLREDLARILRADALRHGLDFKER
ncbi:MAG: hypothetical protein K0R39_3389 [Symbiobacteriaceae bacterium]|nr:hypothetical protein [Symbiobacteriaceae bacterium]